MKKLFALLFAVALGIVIGCGEPEKKAPTKTTTPPKAGEKAATGTEKAPEAPPATPPKEEKK